MNNTIMTNKQLQQKKPHNAYNNQLNTGTASVVSKSFTHIPQTPIKFTRKSSKNSLDKNNNNNNNNNNPNKATKATKTSKTNKISKPLFQFKIGMQVGVSLGDCYLKLQKLEHSMDKLRNISEDITDVMTCLKQLGGIDAIKNNSNDDDDDNDPISEIFALNSNLFTCRKDTARRIKNVRHSISSLQYVLFDLDSQNIHANNQWMHMTLLSQQQIKKLRIEIEETKIELRKKTLDMDQLNKSFSEPTAVNSTCNDAVDVSDAVMYKNKLLLLEKKEAELDRDAEMISKQSLELKKESNKLLRERDEVLRQKENWIKMIEDIKEQKLKLEKKENNLILNHKKLLNLQESLLNEKKKLHKKAKKIKAREKKFNILISMNSNLNNNLNNNNYNNNINNIPPSSNGSDYATSELTYFSDGDTDLVSVNSISDGSINSTHSNSISDKSHKKQLNNIAHLGVPHNHMF